MWADTSCTFYAYFFFFLLLDVNCVTPCASAFRPGASALCVCVFDPVQVRGDVRVSVGVFCKFVHACAHTRDARARARVRWGRREEPGRRYFKLFLLSDCLASQLSLLSTVCWYFPSSLQHLSPAWMDDGLWLSRWMLELHSGSDQTGLCQSNIFGNQDLILM